MSDLHPGLSDRDSIQKITLETSNASVAELVQHQVAAILKLKAENQALRALIIDNARQNFFDSTFQPQVAVFKLHGVTHRIFVYADAEHLIHMIET